MNTAVIACLLMYCIGFGLIVTSIYMLVGQPWAVLAAGIVFVGAAFDASRGLKAPDSRVMK